jgi:ribosomal protein S18 acetylase RimI-like enzyme
MDSIYETGGLTGRFLCKADFGALYEAFLSAFSDYLTPVDLTEEQFRKHILLNAVDLDRSFGWFDHDVIVGFTLNGFGIWHGIPTVYDAGTGIRPAYRRRGLSKRMFERMLPIFTADGYRQCLLEVITENFKAIKLYEGLGFEPTRTVSLLHCPEKLNTRDSWASKIELCPIDIPDWQLLRTFWDGEPSWQNSTEAIDRSRSSKRFTGAFVDGRCVGYIVYSANVGRVAHLAVEKSYRNQGIANCLVRSLADDTAENYVPQVINIDRSIESAMTFFKNRGFNEKLSQFEMVRPI